MEEILEHPYLSALWMSSYTIAEARSDLYATVFSVLRRAVRLSEYRGVGLAWGVNQDARWNEVLSASDEIQNVTIPSRAFDREEMISPSLVAHVLPRGLYHSHLEQTMSLFAHQIEEACPALAGGDDAELQSVVTHHVKEMRSLAKAQYEDLRFVLLLLPVSSDSGLHRLLRRMIRERRGPFDHKLEAGSEPELEAGFEPELEAGSELELACNAIVLAVALLSVIFLYLLGYANTKASSSRSVHFRGDTYICIVLFLGSYVWIKFRQAAPNTAALCNRKRKSWADEGEQPSDRGFHRISITDKASGQTIYKYKPVFTPPRGRNKDNRLIKPSRLSLGMYDTPEEALMVRQLADYYYHGKETSFYFCDGSRFPIPAISEDEQSSGGENADPLLRRRWITQKVIADFLNYQKQNARLKQQSSATTTDAHFGHGRDAGSDPAPSAVDVATCSVQGTSNSADEPISLSEDELYALCEACPEGLAAELMHAPADNACSWFLSYFNSETWEQPSSSSVPPGEMDGVIPEVDGQVSNLPDQSGLIASAASSEHVRRLQVNPSPVSRQLQGNRAAAIVVCKSNVTDGLQGQAESPKETRDTRKEELFREVMDIWEKEHEAAHKKQIAEIHQFYQDRILKLEQEHQDRILKLEQEKGSMQSVILQAFKVLSSHAGN